LYIFKYSKILSSVSSFSKSTKEIAYKELVEIIKRFPSFSSKSEGLINNKVSPSN
jgi:hypothetical protein